MFTFADTDMCTRRHKKGMYIHWIFALEAWLLNKIWDEKEFLSFSFNAIIQVIYNLNDIFVRWNGQRKLSLLFYVNYTNYLSSTTLNFVFRFGESKKGGQYNLAKVVKYKL